MTDDPQSQTLPPAPSPSDDPLASLEELLNKAKSKRAAANPSGAPAEDNSVPAVPMGPTAEEIQAQQLAEQQAQLAIQEEKAETERQQQLTAQRQKMSEEIQNTPEYQARQDQNQEEQQKAEQQKAEQQGHVIHQVTDAKL